MHMHACITGHMLSYGVCGVQIKSNVDLGKICVCDVFDWCCWFLWYWNIKAKMAQGFFKKINTNIWTVLYIQLLNREQLKLWSVHSPKDSEVRIWDLCHAPLPAFPKSRHGSTGSGVGKSLEPSAHDVWKLFLPSLPIVCFLFFWVWWQILLLSHVYLVSFFVEGGDSSCVGVSNPHPRISRLQNNFAHSHTLVLISIIGFQKTGNVFFCIETSELSNGECIIQIYYFNRV